MLTTRAPASSGGASPFRSAFFVFSERVLANVPDGELRDRHGLRRRCRRGLRDRRNREESSLEEAGPELAKKKIVMDETAPEGRT